MDKNKKRITLLMIWRRSLQILSFLLLPGLFTSIFYAMKEIYVSVISGKFSFKEMEPQLLLFVGSILLTILLGRFFCGFLCSFGAMGDLLWFLSQKTIKSKWKIKEKADIWLKQLKYVILVIIILGIWTWNIGNIDSMASPWTVFGIYSKISSWSSPAYFLSIGGFLLLLIMLGSLFVERFFCRYLCPLGAIFAVTSRFRVFHIIKKREQCGTCRMCTNKCSMGIPLYEYDTVTSGECINCLACTIHCPRQNAKANAAPVVVSAVSTVAMFGLFYAGNIVTETQNNNTESIATVQRAEVGNYIDGTYSGTGQGFRGETEVSVTVENADIADITITSYLDDEQFFAKAKDSIIQEIMQKQDVNVDAVSGATYSSNGIMEAVADALGTSYINTNSDVKEEGHNRNKGKGSGDREERTEEHE